MRSRRVLPWFWVLAISSPAGADPDWPPVIPCQDAPPDMACIPGGPFLRGSDDGPAHARPAAIVFVQTFYMDRHEVTVAEYRACVKARKCPQAGPRYVDFDRPRQPITGVSWYDAVAYCRAQGKHLPTEAEWEKAARGTDGRLYPWGNDPIDCTRAVYMDASGRSCGVRKARGGHPEKGRPLEVGSRPPGIHGLYDMVGNSWEWVADWYSDSYAACGADCQGVDPKGPCQGREPCPGHSRRVVRGGSWYWPAPYNTTIYRRAHIPRNDPEFHHFGFRCAASEEERAALLRSP
ncbi:MAG TPA: SUMF1/EgtB/PvdO family nonheme iron enzyme [Myxococcota bacterium]|nr:SUMF1/EgtB/PvdO family nonheme iron enzyme [Myxococcota bacterium]HQK50200.1 SUMF1/EgtB/PvdO family nonheme iron enzyme [Myxococcota bacterium]